MAAFAVRGQPANVSAEHRQGRGPFRPSTASTPLPTRLTAGRSRGSLQIAVP